ncbi:hypothetical protein [Zymobacter sp. IVIA_12111.31 C1]|uniref:hypothetical protein n=1 Tax=Zymobacter sp. IVIA_12111.31 C1 TaxID=3394854 RepID=UPI0039C3B13D
MRPNDFTNPIIAGGMRIEILSTFISKLENGARSPKMVVYDTNHFPKGKLKENALASQAIIALDNSQGEHEDDCIECLALLLALQDEQDTRKKVKTAIDNEVARAKNGQSRADIVRKFTKDQLRNLT